MIFQVFDISVNGDRTTDNSDSNIREFSIWQRHMFLTGSNWYRESNILNLKMVLIYMILESLYLHAPDHILTTTRLFTCLLLLEPLIKAY